MSTDVEPSPPTIEEPVSGSPIDDDGRPEEAATGFWATTHDVAAVVQDAIGAMVDAGKVSAGVVADGAERAARALSRRVITGAVAAPRPVGDERLLASALSVRPSANIAGGMVGAVLGLRALKRIGPLARLTKRSPLWLAVSALPAFTASVTHGSDEMALVASLLTHRANGAGVEPDADRVRRATVQILSREPVDPDVEPSHGTLVVGWLRRGVRAALPYTKGAATRDPKGLAAAAAAVDPNRLAAPG